MQLNGPDKVRLENFHKPIELRQFAQVLYNREMVRGG
jgi:hypothetical protein